MGATRLPHLPTLPARTNLNHAPTVCTGARMTNQQRSDNAARAPHAPPSDANQPVASAIPPALSAPTRRDWPLLLGLAAAVVVVVAITFWPVLDAQAISLDDHQFLVRNPLVQNPSWASVQRFFAEVRKPTTVQGYYLPLSMTSLMLDYARGGRPDHLLPFHQTALALHLLNTLLVILLLYLLFGQVGAAALIGLLFGVHPLMVEPLAWVGERKTLLAATFAFASIVLYVAHARRPRRCAYVLSLLAYVAALLSKPTAVPLPAMLLLIDYWPLRRLSPRGLLRLAPFFVLGGLFAIVTISSHSATASIQIGGAAPAAWPLLLCYLLPFYLAKIVWPAGLTSVYAAPDPLSIFNPIILVSTIANLLLLGHRPHLLAAHACHRRRHAGVPRRPVPNTRLRRLQLGLRLRQVPLLAHHRTRPCR